MVEAFSFVFHRAASLSLCNDKRTKGNLMYSPEMRIQTKVCARTIDAILWFIF